MNPTRSSQKPWQPNILARTALLTALAAIGCAAAQAAPPGSAKPPAQAAQKPPSNWSGTLATSRTQPPAGGRAPQAPAVKPQWKFNRQTVGAQAPANAALKQRAYSALDRHQAGQSKADGLRPHPFKNHPVNGVRPLPERSATGAPVTYTSMDLRPKDGARSYKGAMLASSGRVAIGSDGRAYLSAHHGDKGGRIVRVQ
jgi:hypothetical protein